MDSSKPTPEPPSPAVVNGLGIFLIAMIPLLIVGLVEFWPAEAPPGATEAPPVHAFWGAFTISRDASFFAVAAIAGALGSYLHAATSFADYLGNQRLGRSWIWWYVLRIPIGAALGVIFALFLRAGLLGGGDPKPYVVAAVGALSGLFSRQAIDKMRELFDTFFQSAVNEERAGKLDRGTQAPVITEVAPGRVAKGKAAHLVLTGRGFADEARVLVGESERDADVKDENRIELDLADGDTQAGPIALRVRNPDGARSEPREVQVA